MRYTEWYPRGGKKPEMAALTDLEKDPGEQTNSIDDPEYLDFLTRAKKELRSRISAALK